MDLDGLEGVIKPLLDAICPAKIKEPKTRIAQLTRKMLKDQLGNKGYVDIVDRFILDDMEKKPEEAFIKLLMMRAKLTEIIDELIDELVYEEMDEYVEHLGEREE